MNVPDNPPMTTEAITRMLAGRSVDLEPGDYVTVGDGKLAWEILQVGDNDYYVQSGNWGRKQHVPKSQCKLYMTREEAARNAAATQEER